jgi:Helix-turn-helix
MITSERQLLFTKKQIASLAEEIKNLEKEAPKKPFGKTAVIQAKALLQELQFNVEEYEALKANGVKGIQINNLSEIMILPIKYRIAKGMTQEAFAKEFEISLRTIARYEAENYRNASGDNFDKILKKLQSKLKFMGSFQELIS